MTEKRFEIVGENFTNVDVTTYIVEYGDGDDDCFELYESKEDSQKVCDKLNNILDENEQLKSTINTLTHDNTKMKKVLNTTKKENEHIKNTIKEAYNSERTHIGKSVLKQLLETIQ